MKPETDHPYPVGTRVMVVRAAESPELIGATGEIVERLPLRVDNGGSWVYTWLYLVHLDRFPGPSSGFWWFVHPAIVPLAPPDAIAEPRRIEAPVRDEVAA